MYTEGWINIGTTREGFVARSFLIGQTLYLCPAEDAQGCIHITGAFLRLRAGPARTQHAEYYISTSNILNEYRAPN